MKISAIIDELRMLIEVTSDEIEKIIICAEHILQLYVSVNESLRLLDNSEREVLECDFIYNSKILDLETVLLGFCTLAHEKEKSMFERLRVLGCRLNLARTDFFFLTKVSKTISLAERAELHIISKGLERVGGRLSIANLAHKRFLASVDIDKSEC